MRAQRDNVLARVHTQRVIIQQFAREYLFGGCRSCECSSCHKWLPVDAKSGNQLPTAFFQMPQDRAAARSAPRPPKLLPKLLLLPLLVRHTRPARAPRLIAPQRHRSLL